MARLFFTLVVIAAGLGLGYGLQRAAAAGRIALPMPIADLRRLLQKVGLLFFMAFSFMATLWIIRLDNLRVAWMPALGLSVLACGGALALLAARLLKLDRRQTGSFFACGSFSNIGSIGALAVYLFLGEAAFAYVPLYKLFEETAYYTIGFPITRFFSAAGGGGEPSVGGRLGKVLADPFVFAALVAMIVGGGLNLAGVERPALFGTLNAVCIPTGTFLLLTSIGLAMRFASAANHLRACAAIAAIKFMILPLFATLCATMLGFGVIDGGLPLKVVMILSAMPVAFTALIPPSLYDLDLDLSNACWLTSTLALAVVLPALYLIVR